MNNSQLKAVLAFASDGKHGTAAQTKLNCVYVDLNNGCWVATDSYVMVVVQEDGLKDLVTEDGLNAFAIPADTVSLAIRAGSKNDSVVLTRETINGIPYKAVPIGYPNYERAIPAVADKDKAGVIGFIASKNMKRLEDLEKAFGSKLVASLPSKADGAIRLDMMDEHPAVFCVCMPIKRETVNKFLSNRYAEQQETKEAV